MTKKDFIAKFRGQVPSVTGGGRYRNWQELEQDMSQDLDLLISLSQAPAVQQRTFNLNNEFLVKLKGPGYQRLVDLHNEMADKTQSISNRTIADFEKLADKAGYLRFQAWDFIRKFGDVTGPSFKDYYFVDVIFNEKDLVPYFKQTQINEESAEKTNDNINDTTIDPNLPLSGPSV